MIKKLKKIYSEAQDFLPINGTDYVEFYVEMQNKLLTFIKLHLAFSLLHILA